MIQIQKLMREINLMTNSKTTYYTKLNHDSPQMIQKWYCDLTEMLHLLFCLWLWDSQVECFDFLNKNCIISVKSWCHILRIIDVRTSGSEKEQPVQASGRRWTRSQDCKLTESINWKHQDFSPEHLILINVKKKSLGLDRLPLIANILRKNPGFHQIYISFFP